MRIGDIDVVPVVDAAFRLDGGAMFGSVPKVLWSKRAPADDANRIALGVTALLIRTGGVTVLVDAGIGETLSPKEREMFAVEGPRLERSLGEHGVSPADIHVVVATHLHWDHAGGFTTTVDNRLAPRFPNARYVVRRGEWEDATHPHERNRASYHARDFEPLAEAGVIDFIDGDGDVAPGVSVWRTGGHTAHHQIVRIDSGGRTALFLADLVPTAAHIDEPWIMGYDLYPMDTLTAKKRWLSEAERGEYVIFFEHDPAMTAGVIRRESGRKRVDALEP